MTQKNILVIDDSATIRRLCDSELSGAGYHVILAKTAEDGIKEAGAKEAAKPDLIILDHQLPGTTGYEVCLQLLSDPSTAGIPVVASSTLRKKAYAEYLDCDNVVDMLPKPYTPEALIATVESALNTAQMVVQSQREGLSVPEVIDANGESDLAGEFGCFGLREVIDMLNNGMKVGCLEVETTRCRVLVYMENGRIQAVTASGVDPGEVAKYMPEALSELSPVMKLTVAGRRGSEVDGLVELLNNKVLDPRLLKKLLRLQAAVLLRYCFNGELRSFRFDQKQYPPSLFTKLPLDASLLSLLVEGALLCNLEELPACDSDAGFVRRAMRGQNLDRAGLSSRHMKLMSAMAKPVSVVDLAKRLGWSEEEARRVLHGYELAELVEQSSVASSTKIYGVVSSPRQHQKIESLFTSQANVSGKVVNDWLALRLLLRRQKPEILMVEIENEESFDNLKSILSDATNLLQDVRLFGIGTDSTDNVACELPISFEQMLSSDCDHAQMMGAISESQKCREGVEV